MLLVGEGSEATEPYNKYDKIRLHSVRSLPVDQKVRPLSFRPEKFDLFTATQKNWIQRVYVKTAQDSISRMDDKRSKVFNAHQGKFGSQWLIVVPCKNLGLKFDDQQLRIPSGLRLGANTCVAHTCHCGKRVERDGVHGLSCTKSAGRFSRLATLNSLIKQTLGSLGFNARIAWTVPN